MNWLAVILGAMLCLTGAVVLLLLLPKVSADQRPLLRGVAAVQLALGAGAVLLATLAGLLPTR